MSSHASLTPAVEIRHGQMPLMVARLRGPDVASVLAELEHRYGDAPGFFEDEPLLLDLAQWSGSQSEPTPLERQALLDGLRRVGLRPIAFCGGSSDWQAALCNSGLVLAELEAQLDERVASAPPVLSAPAETVAAMVVDRPLRSGQQLYARGCDLVVLAMVNPGAEVVADGNIHVYAPLRGKAIAGASGMAEARIFALAFEAELVAIAGVYQTAEIPWPQGVRSKPAQVRLSRGPEGDKLLLEPLS